MANRLSLPATEGISDIARAYERELPAGAKWALTLKLRTTEMKGNKHGFQ